MKDFYKLRQECLEEVMLAGIEPGLIVSWEINSRAKKRWGLCTQRPNHTYEIQISASLLNNENVSEKACKETIIHEILHTCKGCMQHTGAWKRYASIMNEKYGYNIKRCTSTEDKEYEAALPEETAKYIFKCKKCGQEISRSRKCRFTQKYKSYGCGVCHTPRAFIQIK